MVYPINNLGHDFTNRSRELTIFIFLKDNNI